MLRLTAPRGANPYAKQWIQRQANDPFVAQARREGYVARSAFKLTHIDDEFGLFTPQTAAVVDLGSAPGGWLQVIQRRVPPEAALFAVDLQSLRVPIVGVRALQGDFSSAAVQRSLGAALTDAGVAGQINVVTSDMAPHLGHHKAEYALVGLSRNAIAFAVQQLAPGGHFVCKTLGDVERMYPETLAIAYRHFLRVAVVKPPASRATSAEKFLVCTGKLESPRDSTTGIEAAAMGAKGKAGKLGYTKYGLDDWPGLGRSRNRKEPAASPRR